MAVEPWTRRQSSDLAYDVSQINNDLSNLTDALVSIPFINGSEVSFTAVGGTTVDIPHGLNRPYSGFIHLFGETQRVGSLSGAAAHVSGGDNDTSLFIRFLISGFSSFSATWRIWVF